MSDQVMRLLLEEYQIEAKLQRDRAEKAEAKYTMLLASMKSIAQYSNRNPEVIVMANVLWDILDTAISAIEKAEKAGGVSQ